METFQGGQKQGNMEKIHIWHAHIYVLRNTKSKLSIVSPQRQSWCLVAKPNLETFQASKNQVNIEKLERLCGAKNKRHMCLVVLSVPLEYLMKRHHVLVVRVSFSRFDHSCSHDLL